MNYLIYGIVFLVIITCFLLAFFLIKHKKDKILKKEKTLSFEKKDETEIANLTFNKKKDSEKVVPSVEEIKEDEPIFEDFKLEDLIVSKNVFDLSKPSFNVNDENEDDDDFDDIEKTYQEFLNRRKNSKNNFSGTRLFRNNRTKTYDMDDFKKDYFENGIDIDDIMKKMTPEMKNILLSKILARKDYDSDDFV